MKTAEQEYTFRCSTSLCKDFTLLLRDNEPRLTPEMRELYRDMEKYLYTTMTISEAEEFFS